MSLKERIQSVDDQTKKLIHIDEWNEDVLVCSMTAAERDYWEAKVISYLGNMEKNNYIRALVAILCCADPETGERLFKMEDLDWLNQKSAKALDQIYAVATEVNCLRQEDIDALKKT